MRPNLAILAMGGTIAMTAKSGTGVVPTMTGNAMVEAVPELAQIATIVAEQVAQKASCALSFQDTWVLTERIRDLQAGGTEGIIITQGTDAIEETSFLLDCLIDLNIPVVVTGAMRNPSLPGADGPANLLAAARVAAIRSNAHLGVLVVFDSQIHAARHVVKCDSVRGDAFGSPLAGPVGRVVEDRVLLFAEKLPALRRPAANRAPDADIRLHVAAIGDRQGVISRLSRNGCDGVVLAAMGGGHVSPDLCDEISSVAEAIPLVLASRTTGGQILKSTYGYPGGEMDLIDRGAISSGWLHPLKARILLNCLVTEGADHERIRTVFQQFDGG
ncbi:MAG: asparaginase [Rhodobacteraceae bacterium]|nr:asparaginase [Paracoccaceae bacterium]